MSAFDPFESGDLLDAIDWWGPVKASNDRKARASESVPKRSSRRNDDEETEHNS
ncbi:hypothetical protein AB6A23_01465 [Paenibacillus tarimensis]